MAKRSNVQIEPATKETIKHLFSMPSKENKLAAKCHHIGIRDLELYGLQSSPDKFGFEIRGVVRSRKNSNENTNRYLIVADLLTEFIQLCSDDSFLEHFDIDTLVHTRNWFDSKVILQDLADKLVPNWKVDLSVRFRVENLIKSGLEDLDSSMYYLFFPLEVLPWLTPDMRLRVAETRQEIFVDLLNGSNSNTAIKTARNKLRLLVQYIVGEGDTHLKEYQQTLNRILGASLHQKIVNQLRNHEPMTN